MGIIHWWNTNFKPRYLRVFAKIIINIRKEIMSDLSICRRIIHITHLLNTQLPIYVVNLFYFYNHNIVMAKLSIC